MASLALTSDYRSLSNDFGLRRFSPEAMRSVFEDVGFEARLHPTNYGPNRTRQTWIGPRRG